MQVASSETAGTPTRTRQRELRPWRLHVSDRQTAPSARSHPASRRDAIKPRYTPVHQTPYRRKDGASAKQCPLISSANRAMLRKGRRNPKRGATGPRPFDQPAIQPAGQPSRECRGCIRTSKPPRRNDVKVEGTKGKQNTRRAQKSLSRLWHRRITWSSIGIPLAGALQGDQASSCVGCDALPFPESCSVSFWLPPSLFDFVSAASNVTNQSFNLLLFSGFPTGAGGKIQGLPR